MPNQTGMPFEEWLRNPSGLLVNKPIGLRDIDMAIREGFGPPVDQKQWFDRMVLCIAALLRRGWRPMLYDGKAGAWLWTDRFDCPDEFGDGPEGVAAAAVTSWIAFGDSGGAEALRFATAIPPAHGCA